MSDANQAHEADKQSLTKKPAGTVAWFFSCTICGTVKPYFVEQIAVAMKKGVSCRCSNQCREKPQPWKTNEKGEVTPSARFDPSQHRFQKRITL